MSSSSAEGTFKVVTGEQLRGIPPSEVLESDFELESTVVMDDKSESPWDTSEIHRNREGALMKE